MNMPRRAYVLTLTIGADTRDDLIGELNHIQFLIATNDLSVSTSGGPSTSHRATLTVDESITHALYMERLEAWLQADRAAQAARESL